MTVYSTGVVIGIVVGLIITAIVLKIINKNGSFKTEYDERQKAVRGTAYKYGFFATVIANAVLMILATTDYDVTKLGFTLNFIPILIGIIVQVTYCVFNDGYVGLNTNMPRFIVFMILISAFNFFIGIMAGVHGELLKDGVFQGPLTNLLVGGLFIVLAIELLIKKVIDGKEE